MGNRYITDMRERIESGSIPEPTTGCWVWMQNIDCLGYGNLQVNYRSVRAHRASYEAFNGPIPSDLVIDHACFHKWCVNPAHLRLLTRQENLLRWPPGAREKKRTSQLRTECRYGHGPSRYIHRTIGNRSVGRCLECHRLAAAKGKH